MSNSFKIGEVVVGDNFPTYFIAEISANHDGDLGRALELIQLAGQVGADCAKFQYFRAHKIASRSGFEAVGKLAHQAGWKEEVYDAFARLSVPFHWTPLLKAECDKAGIEFMATPYDLEAVRHLALYSNAFKIGSGDINYTALIEEVGLMGKPVLLATGASWDSEVDYAVGLLERYEVPLCIMQCNTNYTGQASNYQYTALNTLKYFKEQYPQAVLGLSDHTIGLAPVLGAVALGARVIERHFTDDPAREGPDHEFSLDPGEFWGMVRAVRQLEECLSKPIGPKLVQANEAETRILQRRCLRAAKDLPYGHIIQPEDLVALRPAPRFSYGPDLVDFLVGRKLTTNVIRDNPFTAENFSTGDSLL